MEDALRLSARRVRGEIARGALRGDALLAQILAVPERDRDVWVDEALGFGALPDDAEDLPRGSVGYLPSGVEEIVAMIREVPLRADHTFVDVGAGLGRVSILAHLLSGAAARGVEIQAALVRAARHRCAELALPISFEHGSAADAELDGDVVYLYAPFSGEVLKRVTRNLERLARTRPVVICAVGLEFRGEAWLSARATSSALLTIYEST